MKRVSDFYDCTCRVCGESFYACNLSDIPTEAWLASSECKCGSGDLDIQYMGDAYYRSNPGAPRLVGHVYPLTEQGGLPN